MIDHLTLGTTPPDEPCAQVGAEGYATLARAEARRFINGLIHYFGQPPEGGRFVIRSFPHDFGSYIDVLILFDTESQDSIDYAFLVEGNMPGTWDELENTKYF